MLKKLLISGCVLCSTFISTMAGSVIDSIQFGDVQSENAHHLRDGSSEIIQGAVESSARQLFPFDGGGWRGGWLLFEMAVDPSKPNYFTAKFWGEDISGEHSRLMLFIDGKQVGQRHLGEVDMLDTMYEYPRSPGKFFYKTLPLPENMTRGKTSVELAIQAQGPIWGYGDTVERYQKSMSKPSRGIYAAHVHTDPYFEPPVDDPQGEVKGEFPTRSKPGREVLKKAEKRVNDEIDKLLKSKGEMNMEGIRFLAKACLEPWSDAYRNKDALEKIVSGIDAYYLKFEQNPSDVQHDWIGYGPVADAFCTLADPLKRYLDQKIPDTKLTRHKAWAEMFAASRDYHVKHRRSYTNQSMIVDMNIYYCNRALEILAPSQAWSESKALKLLHESAGIEPWSGSWSEDGRPSWSMGKDHMLFTEEALTKELGYVGHYGEIVIGMLLEVYDASRPNRDEEGDAKLKEQLVKMTKARAVFRYPLPDPDGYRSMHIETVIGWRDWYYPGGTTYEQMWTEGPLDVAAATLDPVLIGHGQQMIEDNQFFVSLEKRLKLRGWNSLTRLLKAPRSYETVKAQPQQSVRLPMTHGQPDFVFADPEIGVVALKNGSDILYVSLYWRARYAINNLARVHNITPIIERDATVNIETRFNDSGQVYTIPDQTNEPFNRRHESFYKSNNMYLAMAGEEQPIARVPSDQKNYKPGKENPYAGKGNFYLMDYGPYLIAMNCTKHRTYEFTVPSEFIDSVDLVSGQTASFSTMSVKPWQTVVLYKNK